MSMFGEIVEPSSRSLWEDWEEINADEFSRLQWQTDLEIKEKIENFIILEGKYLADSIGVQKMELINTVPGINLQLFKIADANQLVCVLKEYNLVQSSEIVDLFKDLIVKSKNVIAILTKPLVEFQTSEIATQGCLIRSLSTSEPESGICAHIKYPKLEQPNIISGVSAGAVWLREHLGLSAIAVVFYVEVTEDFQVQLHALLQNLNIVAMKTQSIQVLSSNLYI